MTTNETGSGKNRLFNDSKMGLIVTGVATVAIDAVLDAAINGLTNYDPSEGGWGWGTTVISAVVATVLGAVTAYKARRDSRAGGNRL